MLNSIQDGAEALLKESAQILSKFPSKKYVVIGGWCPFLRNTTNISHPGTLDVDILFEDSESGSLSDIIKAFLEAGFLVSAKHKFQLMKKLVVRDQGIIYNVDLLHPDMTQANVPLAELYVDHLELDIPLDKDELRLKQMASIVLPNSKMLFLSHMNSRESIDGVSFNLVTFTGMFFTKIESCQKPKRERDSFDIFLAFHNNDVDLSAMQGHRPDTFQYRIEKSIDNFRNFLNRDSEVFNRNVRMFCANVDGIIGRTPADFIISKL